MGCMGCCKCFFLTVFAVFAPLFFFLGTFDGRVYFLKALFQLDFEYQKSEAMQSYMAPETFENTMEKIGKVAFISIIVACGGDYAICGRKVIGDSMK